MLLNLAGNHPIKRRTCVPDPLRTISLGDPGDAEPLTSRTAAEPLWPVRARSMDQLLAQVFVAALADPEQLWLAASGELSRDQTEPCGEIPSTVEALRLTNSGDKGGSDNRPDPGDRDQPASLRAVRSPTNRSRDRCSVCMSS